MGEQEVGSDGEISVVTGHISLKDSRLGCIKAALHKRREKGVCVEGRGVGAQVSLYQAGMFQVPYR